MGLFSYDSLDGEETSYEADLGINSTHHKKKRRRKGLTNFRLKMIAGILAFVGLLGTSVCSMNLPEVATDADFGTLSLIIVCVACLLVSVPLYAWILVEGFRNSQHMWRYFFRLLALAAVCEVPWDLATWQYQRFSTNVYSLVGVLYSGIEPRPWFNLYTQNPIWGLATCELVLCCFAWIRKHQEPTEDEGPKQDVYFTAGTAWFLRLLLLFAAVLWMYLLSVGQLGRMFPIGLMTLVFVLIFYSLRSKENTMMILAAAICALEALAPAVGVLILHFQTDEEGFAHTWTRWLWYPAAVLGMLVPGLIACQGLL